MYHNNIVMHIKFNQNGIINASVIALDLILSNKTFSLYTLSRAQLHETLSECLSPLNVVQVQNCSFFSSKTS